MTDQIAKVVTTVTHKFLGNQHWYELTQGERTVKLPPQVLGWDDFYRLPNVLNRKASGKWDAPYLQKLFERAAKQVQNPQWSKYLPAVAVLAFASWAISRFPL